MLVAAGDGGDRAIIVEFLHGFFGEVASVGCLPFVVGIGQYCSDQTDDGGLVGEDAGPPGNGV